MGIKSVIKSITPSPIWKYLRHKKHLQVLSDYLSSTGAYGFSGFLLLDSEEDYAKTGKVFNGEQYYSQAYQDYFLDNYIFRKKEGGFFLDIGGNDPVSINNTYFFEKSRGWSGLAFEPLDALREKWKTSRKTECLPYALGASAGEVEFCEYVNHGMSGLSDEVEYGGKVKARYKVPIKRLADILDERGIKHVDFVSLDVEGAEIGVLSGIDFSRVDIDCFTIENNKGWQREKRLRRFMINAGYRLKARLWLDEVWIKRNPE